MASLPLFGSMSFPLEKKPLIAKKKKEHQSKQDERLPSEHIVRVLSQHEIGDRRFYSGIMPGMCAEALPMQVFRFPAGGERTCKREIDRARFGASLDVPRKFATDTWGHRIARLLDPRKVPGITRYALVFAQQRDFVPDLTPLRYSSINSRLNGCCWLPRANGAPIAHLEHERMALTFENERINPHLKHE